MGAPYEAGDFRIMYQHQVLSDHIYYEDVSNVHDAMKKLETIYSVMLSLGDNNIIPDFSNVGMIQVFNGEDWENMSEDLIIKLITR